MLVQGRKGPHLGLEGDNACFYGDGSLNKTMRTIGENFNCKETLCTPEQTKVREGYLKGHLKGAFLNERDEAAFLKYTDFNAGMTLIDDKTSIDVGEQKEPLDLQAAVGKKGKKA